VRVRTNTNERGVRAMFKTCKPDNPIYWRIHVTKVLTIRDSNTAVAEVNWADPFASLANSLSQPGMQGEPIKFSKGRWLAGRGTSETDASGKLLVADVENLMTGWRCWKDKRLTDQLVGLVAEGFKPPQRNELGDVDSSKWEIDSGGNATDPWQFGFYLRLTDPETEEAAFSWAATSHGAKRAIGDLARAYAGQLKKTHPYRCSPVVKLASDFYKHRDYGRVDTPKLEIVDLRVDYPAISQQPDDYGEEPLHPYGLGEEV
jgi:hypothetical protein